MEPVQLKLSTLSSKQTVIQSHKLIGLQVRGFYSNKKIPLPMTYSREFIPASLSNIPTPKTARAWSHLEHLAEEIAPSIDCDVGLLIGYNCSQALLPREIVSGKDNEPFAVRTDLGWSIIGCVIPCIDYCHATGSSHRLVRQDTSSLQSSVNLTSQVQYVCRTQVKEVVAPTDGLKVQELDFSESNVEDAHFSKNDLSFISMKKEGIKVQADGCCEMPLPLKENKPCLLNKVKCADHRLRCLRKTFEKDKHKDYVAFMSNITTCEDARRFHENRIQRIKNSTRPDQWRPVSSEDSSADLRSRGLRAKELIASNFCSGPDLLWHEELPSGNVKVEERALEGPEIRNIAVHKTSATEMSLLDLFLEFSYWTRLVKAIARLIWFAKELNGSLPRTNEATSLMERSNAEATIIGLVQRAAFSKEIQSLRHGKELARHASTLQRLNPFLVVQGILMVGGRHADLHHQVIQLLISDSTLDKQARRIGKPVHLERPIYKRVTLKPSDVA